MAHIIALNSIRPWNEEPVYIYTKDLTDERLFALDRALRQVSRTHSSPDWPQFIPVLKQSGFEVVEELATLETYPVYFHSRPWDEHVCGEGESFFVTFPASAPPELATQIFLATPAPQRYTHAVLDEPRDAVSTGFPPVVLLTAEGFPLYPESQMWGRPEAEVQWGEDVEAPTRQSIGPVILIEEQFSDQIDFNRAKISLCNSGYDVLLACPY